MYSTIGTIGTIVLGVIILYAAVCRYRDQAKNTLPTVTFYRGTKTPLRHYAAYFRNLLNLRDDGRSRRVAICHSAGIRAALMGGSQFIIALDPSEIVDDARVFNWVSSSRRPLSTISKNLYIYDIPEHQRAKFGHYPYMIKTIRNRIVAQAIELMR